MQVKGPNFFLQRWQTEIMRETRHLNKEDY